MTQGGILAIDAATVAGFCYVYPGEEPEYESCRCGKRGADHGEVGHAFRQRLGGLIMTHRPRHIVFEAPYIPRPPPPAKQGKLFTGPRKPEMNIATVYRLCGLCFMIEQMAVEFGLRPLQVDTSTWCKWFTGKGRWPGGAQAKKAAVMAECAARGWPVTNDNQSDAIGIAMYAEYCLAPNISAQRRGTNEVERNTGLAGL
jgi:hypothetical protein